MHTACLSFSATAHALEVLHKQGKVERAPTVETCIQWEMKLGLHKLTRPKVNADDWIWIADHVVSKGVHKCLAVVGVRMSTLKDRSDLTLRLEDLEPLGIVPMQVSNGELVEAEFEKILQAAGGIPPRAIVKDQGSDLRSGGRRFCEAHPEVIDIYDVPHKIALLYKHQLTDDIVWNCFTNRCSELKKQLQLTRYARLSPPNQRSKARYHNIDVLVNWAVAQLPSCNSYEQLKWLQEYKGPIEEWRQLVETGRVTRDLIRKEGLSSHSHEVLSDRLRDVALCPRAEQLACDLVDFIAMEGAKVPAEQSVIASSEILESLFGVHKTIGARGPNPMGRLVLSMASRVAESPSESLITEAFGHITQKTLDAWLEQAFLKTI